MFKKYLMCTLIIGLSLICFANEDVPTKKESVSTTKVVIDEAYLKLADDIQRYSKKFIGIRYLRGGKATKGFDCSGFVIYVFTKFGMKLGACSTELAKLGYKVGSEEALPGDLIFFRRSTNPKSGISHVGIVIESSEKGLRFIHSASSKGVTISHLQDKYYSSHFVGIHRVIDSLKEF